MQITEALCGRQIEYVTRDEDGGISIVCTDGKTVELFVDKDSHIQLRGLGVRIVLPSLSITGEISSI